MMQMNRQWMYGKRGTTEFISGLTNFLDVAESNKDNGFIWCPCVDCQNKKSYSVRKTVHSHLLRKGFMASYNCWTKHGERGVMMEDVDEEYEDDDNYMFPEYGDTERGEAEDEEEPADDHIIDDDLRRCITDIHREANTVEEKKKLQRMLDDQKKNCTQLAKMTTQSWVPHWNCCNERRRIVYVTRHLRSYSKYSRGGF